ncbi:MAG: hypothetical protein IAI50_05050 [Candidatus Eremiobacteraeota bacterium]|nr:hypothetical protein [Candidatus Eremiobacteraeota bacterium]
MRLPSHFGLFLHGAAAVALLAGCSGGGSESSQATSPTSAVSQSIASQSVSTQRGFVNAAAVNAAGGNQIIVSDEFANTVSVFGAAGQLNALLTTGLSQPVGIATDAAENLYVANGQDFNILVYAKPYNSAALTLQDPGLYPGGVAVSQTGVVAVTSPVANPYGPGAVRFYAKGASTACATVTDPNWQGMQFGSFDATGSLFIDGYDRDGNPLVGEIAGGCAATSIVTLSIGNTLANPQDVKVVNGKFLILDQNYNTFAPVIYEYAAPKAGALGTPTGTTKLSAGIEMMTFALTQDNNYLWIAHSGTAAGRIKYTYPGGHFVRSFNEQSFQSAYGIAVNPVARP